MPGPIALYLNHVEMLDDDGHGVEWSMTFEEVLGSIGKATLTVQDKSGNLYPRAHWDVKAVIRSSGWVLYRGEVITPSLDLGVGEPWPRWQLACSDYNNELAQRKIGAFDGKTWLDTSGLGIFVNIDPYGVSLGTDKLTVQALFDHYFRVDGSAAETTTHVFEYLTEIFPIEWAYGDLQKALEELAALIVNNLQFWLDPDLKFHWVVIPPWQDILQDGTIVGADESQSVSALMFPEGVNDLPFAPYDIVDADAGVDEIGFSKLSVRLDGASMPEQVYVKGGTGYVYNAPASTVKKTVVQAPTPGEADRYELKFLENTRIWHKDSTGYVSTSYDTASASSTWHTCKWVKVAWNESRQTGGNYWKILEGPYQGKLVDDNTNTLSGYGEIKVRKVYTVVGEPIIGVGGTGWAYEMTQDPNKRQAYLEAPISIDQAKRDAIGGQALYRGQYETLRGTVEVYGLDGWRVGQMVKITDVRLPAALNGRYYVIQRVRSALLEGNDLRRYQLDFGDGPDSRWSMRGQPGDITWPPPFAYIEVHAFDLSPGPNSTQRIRAQLVAPDGTPWEIAGKTVNWSFECYNRLGVLQVGQGSIDPEVSVTNRHGRAFTQLTTGPGTNLVYFVYANVKAV